MSWRLLDDGWVEREIMSRLIAAEEALSLRGLMTNFPGHERTYLIEQRVAEELVRLMKEGAVEKFEHVRMGPSGNSWSETLFRMTPLYRLAALQGEQPNDRGEGT